MADASKLLKSIFKRVTQKAGQSAQRAEQEAAEDLFKLSPSMQKMNEEELRIARQKELGEAFAQSPEQKIIEESTGIQSPFSKSAQESAETLSQKPDFELVGNPYTPKDPQLPAVTGTRQPVSKEFMPPSGVKPPPPIEPAYRDVSSSAPMSLPPGKPSRWPSLATIAKGTGAAGAAGLATYGLMSQESPAAEEPMMSEMSPEQMSGEGSQQPASMPPRKAQPKTTKKTQDKAQPAPTPEEEPKSNLKEFDVGTRPDYSSELKDIQEQQNLATLFNQLGSAARKVGSGVLEQKGDNKDQFAEANQQFINSWTQQFKDRIEVEKHDAKSPTSKAFREYAKQLGYDIKGDFSASDAEKVFPFMFKGFEADANREARKEAQQATLEQRKWESSERSKDRAQRDKERKEDKTAQEGNKFIQKANTELIKSKPYNYVQKTTSAMNTVDNALKNPNSVNDISALYDFIKGLDPDSAVREGEVKLGQEALGLWGTIKASIAKAGPNPRILDNKMLRNVQAYLTISNQNAKNQYDKVRQSKFKHAQTAYGLPEERLAEIDPLYDQYAEEKASPAAPKKTQPEETASAKSAGPKEERRFDPKTQKTAIFDAESKKFLRWE